MDEMIETPLPILAELCRAAGVGFGTMNPEGTRAVSKIFLQELTVAIMAHPEECVRNWALTELLKLAP